MRGIQSGRLHSQQGARRPRLPTTPTPRPSAPPATAILDSGAARRNRQSPYGAAGASRTGRPSFPLRAGLGPPGSPVVTTQPERVQMLVVALQLGDSSVAVPLAKTAQEPTAGPHHRIVLDGPKLQDHLADD